MSLRSLGLASLVLLAPAFAACEDGASTSDPTPGRIEVPAPGAPAPAEPACPTTTTGPTVHAGDLAGDETWTAAAGPHVIERTLTIRSGRTLRIEPCAEVQVAKGAHVNVAYPGTPNQGALVAEGTAARPIRFTGRNGERWNSIAVHAPGTARLAHVTLENGGGGDFQESATLAVYGDGLDGADPLLFADHVTIARSLGTGAWLTRGATFTAGSRDLTIRESGSTTSPWPLVVEEHALDALPTGSYTGNAKDEILVDPRGGRAGGSGFLDDATIHDRGVPYHVGRSRGHSLLVGGRTDGKLVTLTVEPGVVLGFEPEAALEVQHFVNSKPSTAAIVAVGTAERPIVFRAAGATPKAGDWRGLWFGGIPDASNRIEHVRVEHAGGDCGCILVTCSAIAQHEGAVIFTAPPPRAFIQHTTFVDVAGHGISAGYDGPFVDFRPTNSFQAVAGCEQTRPRDTTTTCPTPRPACDG